MYPRRLVISVSHGAYGSMAETSCSIPINIYIHIYIYMCIHIYIHIYTHIYIYMYPRHLIISVSHGAYGRG